MLMESFLLPVAKGMFGSALGVGIAYGGGVVVYKKYLMPHPLQEILEERTGKKFSRSTLVSRRFKGNGVLETRYKIPSGLSTSHMLDLKPAIEDKLDCEVQVWSEDRNFVFELSLNPIPKELVYDPKKVVTKLKNYELAMYLGKSRRGDEFFNFTENATPHLLFGGPTGKGKSNLLNQGICGMVEAYSPKQIQFVFIDLKDGVELDGYRNLPHAKAFYETTDQVIGGLELLINELKRRNQLFKSLGVKKISQYNKIADEILPRILIIADEFAQFSNIADNDLRKLTYKKWEEILQKGRSTGIHCLLGTQVTDADVFPKQIKGNIDARFGFGFSDPQHSKMITGGAELTRLPNIMGRGLFKLGDKMIQTQTPKIEDKTILEVLEKYCVEKAEGMENESVTINETTMDTISSEERETGMEETKVNEETSFSIDELVVNEEYLKSSAEV
jgi:DNA segregation ATPase FtsK/SpoIIIE-like protein